MRSPAEIAFRLAQEAANLRMLLLPPRLTGPQSPVVRFPGLPEPSAVAARLAGSPVAAGLIRRASAAAEGEIPFFGGTLRLDSPIRWRRDPISGRETGLKYFRRIPYLDFERAGDHKFIWELSRHQHLVLLAQAWSLTREEAFLAPIWKQLDSWMAANPFQRGINWASALEVAFRAMSWAWVASLAGEQMPHPLSIRFFEYLYRHGCHLEHNLSVHFSPNTHLLGEAVALDALGRIFSGWPRARDWQRIGGNWVDRELNRQVRADGGHFEQSSYYHVYALDMFLFHALLAGKHHLYQDRLSAMARLLAALLGPHGRMPLLGDDDGGRWFYPFGDRATFGRGSLTAYEAMYGPVAGGGPRSDELAAWWVAQPSPPRAPEAPPLGRIFPDTGLAVIEDGPVHIVFDFGPFGPGSAGHSHSDTLSLVVNGPGGEVLIDPGTYTYIADRQWRDRFRGSASHNTVRIGEMDQALAAGPFRWSGPPETALLTWEADAKRVRVAGLCKYRGYTHRRSLDYSAGQLRVQDEIEGPPVETHFEWYWGLGAEPQRLGENSYEVATAILSIDRAADTVPGWKSSVLGSKEPAVVLRSSIRAVPPVRTQTLVVLKTQKETTPS